MQIKKHTLCTIAVGPGDFISNVVVMNDQGFHDDQCGCLIDDRGTPHFVCTELIVNGGKVSTVTVKQGGKVQAIEGEIEKISLWQRGEMFVKNATVRDISEEGGSVFLTDADCTPELTFYFNGYIAIIDGVCTIHNGTHINHTALLADSNCMIYDGGILSESEICERAMVHLHGGSIKTCKSNGELRVYKGVIEDVSVNTGALYIYGGDDITFKNVKVLNTVKIYRKAFNGAELASLDGLLIEDGTQIINEIDEGDNGIYTETIIWNNKVNKREKKG